MSKSKYRPTIIDTTRVITRKGEDVSVHYVKIPEVVRTRLSTQGEKQLIVLTAGSPIARSLASELGEEGALNLQKFVDAKGCATPEDLFSIEGLNIEVIKQLVKDDRVGFTQGWDFNDGGVEVGFVPQRGAKNIDIFENGLVVSWDTKKGYNAYVSMALTDYTEANGRERNRFKYSTNYDAKSYIQVLVERDYPVLKEKLGEWAPMHMSLQTKARSAPKKVLAALHKEGCWVYDGKWILPLALIEYEHDGKMHNGPIKDMFPKASQARPYVSSLLAPILGGRVYRVKVAVMALAVEHNGKWIAVDSDGGGWIAPDSLMSQASGGPGVGAMREIGKKGLFIKGSLVERELHHLLDSQSEQADMIVPPSMVKGVHKNSRWLKALEERNAKQLAAGERPTPSFEIDGKEYQSIFEVDAFYLWKRTARTNVQIAWGFQFLDLLPATEKNIALLQRVVENNFKKVWKVDQMVKHLARMSHTFRMEVELCRQLGVEPLTVPSLYQQMTDELGRLRYLFSQGAGIQSPEYVVAADPRLGENEIILAPVWKDGRWINLPGDLVVVGRYPTNSPQGYRVYRVVAPFNNMLIEIDGQRCLPPNALYVKSKVFFEYHQGDQDGDTAFAEVDPDLVEMMAQPTPWCFGPNAIFLMEGTSWAGSKIEQTHTSTDAETLELFAVDGQGPVGLTTNLVSLFQCLDDWCTAHKKSRPFEMHKALCLYLCQLAVDGRKKSPRWPHPDKMLDPATAWCCVERDGKIYVSPRVENDSLFLTSEDSISLSRNGDEIEIPWLDKDMQINPGAMSAWVDRELVNNGFTEHRHLKTAPSQVYRRWARASGGSKSISSNGLGSRIAEPTNAVDYVFNAFWDLHAQWEKDNKDLAKPVVIGGETFAQNDLCALVLETLGHSDIEPDLENHRALMIKTGLATYASRVQGLMTGGLDKVDRSIQIEQAVATLNTKLATVDEETLLQAWVNLWQMYHEAVANNEDNPTKYITRAFLAIAFPGSPILKKLNGQSLGCTYVTYEILKATEKWFGDHAKEGDMLSLLLKFFRHSKKHEEVVGIPLFQCVECSTKIINIALSIHRAITHRSQPNEDARLLTSKVNALLKG